MSVFRKLWIFCGSSLGSRPVYREMAAQLGQILARNGIELVYGGRHVGLMGAVADAALGAGGRVIGVMPQSLIDREVGHKGLTEMHIVRTMHERKALMAKLAGGYGTLDEFCEILTWAQLGTHAKPCGVLNTYGYYEALLALFDHGVEEGFVKSPHREMLVVAADAAELLKRLEARLILDTSEFALRPK